VPRHHQKLFKTADRIFSFRFRSIVTISSNNIGKINPLVKRKCVFFKDADLSGSSQLTVHGRRFEMARIIPAGLSDEQNPESGNRLRNRPIAALEKCAAYRTCNPEPFETINHELFLGRRSEMARIIPAGLSDEQNPETGIRKPITESSDSRAGKMRGISDQQS
jgi:hypothetical protein